MKLNNLDDLLKDQIKDLYNAEGQLVKALPKMAKKASCESLKEAITEHLAETKNQITRLEKIGEILDFKLTGKQCKAMKGLIEEGTEVLETEGDDDVIDAALIAAAQRVEHYEISAYGTARAFAEELGHKQVVKLLQETLDEEGAADEKLTSISEDDIFPSIAAEAATREESSSSKKSMFE